MPNKALLKDVEQHPDDYIYIYELTQRLGCSKLGIKATIHRQSEIATMSYTHLSLGERYQIYAIRGHNIVLNYSRRS